MSFFFVRIARCGSKNDIFLFKQIFQKTLQKIIFITNNNNNNNNKRVFLCAKKPRKYIKKILWF